MEDEKDRRGLSLIKIIFQGLSLSRPIYMQQHSHTFKQVFNPVNDFWASDANVKVDGINCLN